MTTTNNTNKVVVDAHNTEYREHHNKNYGNEEQQRAAQLASLNTTRFQIFFAFWIALSGTMVNFDFGYGGTVLQMASFRKSFGHCKMVQEAGRSVEICTLSATAQSMVSISTLFAALGAAMAGVVTKYLGRRGVLQFGCFIIAIGAAGQCGTQGNYLTYNICKCISCVGIGHLNTGSPMYGVEALSPSKRGALVAVYSIGLAFGTLISACVCYGSSTLSTNWAWRTPVIIQIPLALLYAAGLSLFPESPRWLLIKGKEEAARLSFARFNKKAPQSPEVTMQVQEVKTYLEFEKSLASSTTFTELFHRSYVRRTAISNLIATIAPLSGVNLVVTYAAVFFSANGVKKPFLIQLYLAICGLTGSAIGPGIVEYGGRRFAAIFGFSCMACCMLLFSSIASGLGGSTETARNTLIAFICIWFFFYASCVSSSHWLISAEVHSVRLRGYGQALSVTVANIFNFASAFWTPYMINPTAGNMGTKVGYFYFGLEIIAIVLLVLFLPETARLSLEQIDDYFASGRKAWRTSIGRNKKIAQGFEFDIAPEAHLDARHAVEEKTGGD